jgi:uncharacterized protein YbaR (Trm112 family)
MIAPVFVDVLRCPIDTSPLVFVSGPLVDAINQSIARGELRDCNEQRVTETVDAGLFVKNSRRFYPIRQGIPTLLPDSAIELDESFNACLSESTS